MSSSSSSSSSLQQEEEEEDEGDIDSSGTESQYFPGGRIGESSSSRMRSGNGVWPEPFVESLAFQVAIDAAREDGRLAAGPALASVFQVSSTWQAVSRSELLWQNLTRTIWGGDRLTHPTWHQDYVHRHRTAYNFRIRRAVYTPLEFDIAGASSDNNEAAQTCRCLALSQHYLACGFLDGSVRLFDLRSRSHISTFRPHPRDDRLGRFSPAVSGIILHGSKVVFASLDGDIHVASIRDPSPPRRAHLGNVLDDGTLVDFTGCSRLWVGLYAGVPGRAFHVWDGDSEELVFIGGSLTDPEAVQGWHLLTDFIESVARVRVSSTDDSGLACTSLKLMVFDLTNHGLILGEEEIDGGIIVNSVDVSSRLFLMIDNRGLARVRRVRTMEEVCRFVVRHRGGIQHLHACLNTCYAFVCCGGIIRAWDAERGQFLYSLRERIGQVSALVADDQRVAGCSSATGIHLWDFSAM